MIIRNFYESDQKNEDIINKKENGTESNLF